MKKRREVFFPPLIRLLQVILDRNGQARLELEVVGTTKVDSVEQQCIAIVDVSDLAKVFKLVRDLANRIGDPRDSNSAVADVG